MIEPGVWLNRRKRVVCEAWIDLTSTTVFPTALCDANTSHSVLTLVPPDARHRPAGAAEGEAAGIGNATSGSLTDKITRDHKMTIDEAQLILNVKRDAPLEEIVKRYEALFKQNSPPPPPEPGSAAAKSKKSPIPTWSHYLQSKVVRARERLEAEAKIAAEEGPNKETKPEAKESKE